jgi:hypothetical protein
VQESSHTVKLLISYNKKIFNFIFLSSPTRSGSSHGYFWFLLQEEAEMLIFGEFINKISHLTFTGIQTVNHKFIYSRRKELINVYN